MQNAELTYMLSANKVAMALFNESKETLMNSTSYDFMVYKFSNWDEVLEELRAWEGYVDIDESTYHELYGNLCVKFRALIKYL